MIPKIVLKNYVLTTEKKKIEKGPQSSDVFNGLSSKSRKGYM